MSYQVIMDDVPLAYVAPSARIVDVIELAPTFTSDSKQRLGAPGSFLLRHQMKERRVRVQFALMDRDYGRRTEAISAIAAWAQGQWLQISDRPGQRLRVVCTELPSTQSKRNWTALCELTFTAYSVPFWEDVQGVTVSASGTECSLSIVCPGNAPGAMLRCMVKPTDNPMETLRISSETARMAFTGLGVPAGAALSIDCQDGILTASWADSDGHAAPCLACRTGDEGIPLRAGEVNRVTVDTDVTADVTILAKGWYW